MLQRFQNNQIASSLIVQLEFRIWKFPACFCSSCGFRAVSLLLSQQIETRTLTRIAGYLYLETQELRSVLSGITLINIKLNFDAHISMLTLEALTLRAFPL